MTEQIKVATDKYEMTDYGIDHAQYFQGHGVSNTEFDHCTLGVGDSFNDAYVDALDQAAIMGFDIDVDGTEFATDGQNEKCSVASYLASQKEPEEDQVDSELTYYVGLRW